MFQQNTMNLLKNMENPAENYGQNVAVSSSFAKPIDLVALTSTEDSDKADFRYVRCELFLNYFSKRSFRFRSLVSKGILKFYYSSLISHSTIHLNRIRVGQKDRIFGFRIGIILHNKFFKKMHESLWQIEHVISLLDNLIIFTPSILRHFSRLNILYVAILEQFCHEASNSHVVAQTNSTHVFLSKIPIIPKND